MGKLEGVSMELHDCAYPLVKSITKSCVGMEAFKGVQYAFMIGGFPRLAGMQRSDLIAKNTAIFSEAGNRRRESREYQRLRADGARQVHPP
ncbi:hypothetical protein BLSTO_02756 [Blastocystis sp. subtype 1]